MKLFAALVLTPLALSTFEAEAQRRVPPNVLLLVDTSASTYWGATQTYCPYWNAAHGYPANALLNKNEIIRAALTECWAPNDGQIYRYARNTQLAAYAFGFANEPMTRLIAPFFGPTGGIHAAIDALVPEGFSPMTAGIHGAGQYMGSTLNNANTAPNARNFILLITDANPNGYDAFFNYACNGDVRWVYADQPASGAEYLSVNPDLFCSLNGNQNISTYVIVVEESYNFDPIPMQEIATRSGGEYYNVQTQGQLRDALKSALSSMLAR